MEQRVHVVKKMQQKILFQKIQKNKEMYSF